MTMRTVAGAIPRQLPALVVVAMLAACGGGGEEPMAVAVQATASGTSAAQDARLAGLPLQPLSVAEAQSLAFMREEEQLAHDVYAQSARLWPKQPIFANIAGSEATHTAAVKSLLDRYGQPDPLAGLSSGSFSTAEFQVLYEELVALSSRSLVDALKVGLQIEELDIRDIEEQKLAIDNAGNVFVAWRKDQSTVDVDTFGAYGSRYAVASGTWSPPVKLGQVTGLNVPEVSVSVSDQGFAAAAVSYLSDDVTTEPAAYNTFVSFYR